MKYQKRKYLENSKQQKECENIYIYQENPKPKREYEKKKYWENPEQKREYEKNKYMDNRL